MRTTQQSAAPSAADAAGMPPVQPHDGGTMARAKEKTQRLAGQAQEQVAQRLGSTVAGLKGPAAGVLGHYAEAVRQLGQQFHQQNRGLAGQYAERAAGQMQRLSDYLQHTEVDELARQLEAAARRRPAVFLGSAFAAGAAAARFLKSSRRQQEQRLARQRAAAGASLGSAASLGTSGAAYAAERDVTGLRPVARDVATGSGATEIGSVTPPATDDFRLR